MIDPKKGKVFIKVVEAYGRRKGIIKERKKMPEDNLTQYILRDGLEVITNQKGKIIGKRVLGQYFPWKGFFAPKVVGSISLSKEFSKVPKEGEQLLAYGLIRRHKSPSLIEKINKNYKF